MRRGTCLALCWPPLAAGLWQSDCPHGRCCQINRTALNNSSQPWNAALSSWPNWPIYSPLFRSILVNNVLQMESNRPLTFTSDVYYSAGKANRSPDNETHIKANDEGIFKHEHIFCRKNAIFSYFHKCCAFIYLRKILNLHIFEEICHIFIFSRQKWCF